MSDERIIGEPIQKNEFTQVRVSIKRYEEREYLHVRTYIRKEGEDHYRPTAKGVAVPIEMAPQMCEAFKELQKHLAANPATQEVGTNA